MVWRPIYALLIIVSTLVDYFASILMEKSNSSIKRKIYLFSSIFTNLGILFIFKYLGFFSEIINGLFQSNFDVIYLILPMGISFYTFQTLSYTIDVYRRDRIAERHLGYFALYVTFFPQLVAGPIERSDRLIPQLRKDYKFNKTKAFDGLQRMIWGFFKKVVIADNLAIAVNHVYGDLESSSGLTILIATVFFAYQIYCDFSGYSDIAIGSAKILGIDLIENFKQPYFSTSIKEFWSRWHISLSTWFRDYVYIPLGGSRKGSLRAYTNILLVFLISGLWHGASWMFVIWGTIHGIYQLYERLTINIRGRLWNFIKLDGTVIQWLIKWVITMSIVLISWVFFRATSLNEVYIIGSTLINDSLNGTILRDIVHLAQMNQIGLGIGRFRMLVVLISMVVLELFQIYKESIEVENTKVLYLRLTIALWMTLLFGNFGLEEFIYFQF